MLACFITKIFKLENKTKIRLKYVIGYAVVLRRRLSTLSNDISSKATGPIEPKFYP